MSKAALVNEIKKRQIAAGGFNLGQAWAAVELMDVFGREPHIDDLGRGGGVKFVFEDLDGNTVALVADGVVKDRSFDRFVSYKFKGSSATILGWTCSDHVNQAVWTGDRAVVDKQFLWGLPSEFRFVVPCESLPCHSNGVWDYDETAWDCFTCGKFCDNAADREAFACG